MSINKSLINLSIVCIALVFSRCKLPSLGRSTENKKVPSSFINSKDSTTIAAIKWKDYFKDENLRALIDTALKNNQELNIMLQEINIAKNEIRARKGAYIPFVGAGALGGVDKVGKHTSQGASDAITTIAPGKPTPEVLPNYAFGVTAAWELDIWKKLRNSKKSAVYKFLSTIEGKNFMVTNLIAEIATSYNELMALDNQLIILTDNIKIQQNALEMVKLEKIAAKVTELAVRKFEAEVLKNQSRQFYILQQIKVTENRINFIVGRFPQPINRNSTNYNQLIIDSLQAGVPSQLLSNRSDIKQAEQDLLAAKLDVKAAKANFYPSLIITSQIGYQAFNPAYLIKTPESLIYSLAGQLIAPLINRNAIKANYYTANSKQIQAVYNYERAVLKAHIEVVNELSNIGNLKNSYDYKSKEVQALTESIEISSNLFKSARADYMEVLLTQRDALDSKFELIETKMHQMNATVNLYKALGGGWR